VTFIDLFLVVVAVYAATLALLIWQNRQGVRHRLDMAIEDAENADAEREAIARSHAALHAECVTAKRERDVLRMECTAWREWHAQEKVRHLLPVNLDPSLIFAPPRP
jgi:uncharacterized membrane protein